MQSQTVQGGRYHWKGPMGAPPLSPPTPSPSPPLPLVAGLTRVPTLLAPPPHPCPPSGCKPYKGTLLLLALPFSPTGCRSDLCTLPSSTLPPAAGLTGYYPSPTPLTGELTSPRAVHLLPSRKRTFLFCGI